MTLNDKSLFLEAMEDVKPLKDCASSQWIKPVKDNVPQKIDTLQLDNFLTTDFLEILPLTVELEFKRDGLQQGVSDKLRLGKYNQQASLNLLRQPVEQCRQRLFAFIQQAQKESLRNLLIVHGKGCEERSHANIVRSYLARWLVEFDEVQAFCCAMPHHGGSGACYVTLKKSEQARLDNRERHAKRSR